MGSEMTDKIAGVRESAFQRNASDAPIGREQQFLGFGNAAIMQIADEAMTRDLFEASREMTVAHPAQPGRIGSGQVFFEAVFQMLEDRFDAVQRRSGERRKSRLRRFLVHPKA